MNDDEINYKKILDLQVRYEFCIRCKKFKRFYAKGLCKYCWNRVKYKDMQKKYSEDWKNRNPNYWKEYYLKNKGRKDV